MVSIYEYLDDLGKKNILSNGYSRLLMIYLAFLCPSFGFAISSSICYVSNLLILAILYGNVDDSEFVVSFYQKLILLMNGLFAYHMYQKRELKRFF